MFTLEQLRAFVAVAEEGSFTRAATRLTMTQPPLSRAVQNLERQVGRTLIDRSRKRALLTPAGRAMLERGRRILALADGSVSQVRSIADGTVGRLAVGYTAMSARAVLGPLVRRLTDLVPDVALELTELVTPAQVDALVGGTLDLGIVRDFPTQAVLRSRAVHREPLLLAVPVEHDFATGDPPRLRDVAGQPMVGYTPIAARYFHDLVAGAFRDVGATPRIVQRATQVNSVLTLVEAGLGVALVPASAQPLESLRFVELDELRDHTVSARVAWRGDNDNPVLPRALNCLPAYREPRTARSGSTDPQPPGQRRPRHGDHPAQQGVGQPPLHHGAKHATGEAADAERHGGGPGDRRDEDEDNG